MFHFILFNLLAAFLSRINMAFLCILKMLAGISSVTMPFTDLATASAFSLPMAIKII